MLRSEQIGRFIFRLTSYDLKSYDSPMRFTETKGTNPRPTVEFSEPDGKMYDAVAVLLEDSTILWVSVPKTLPNAEATCVMAIMRQGLDDRFFAEVPTGKYRDGDKWVGR